MTRWILHDTEPLSWSVMCCTLVCMRRMNLKMLRPIGRRAQSLNPQCSQSHFHPLRRNNPLPPAPTNKHKLLSHASLPELSSFTRDDIVLVMESAAMSRSFLRFLLGPWKKRHCACKKKWWSTSRNILDTISRMSRCSCDTLSEGLLYIPSHAHERVLRCVSRGGNSRVRVDGCWDGPADGVAGGGAWRARTLSLQRREHILNPN